jgi:hypothetical protein
MSWFGISSATSRLWTTTISSLCTTSCTSRLGTNSHVSRFTTSRTATPVISMMSFIWRGLCRRIHTPTTTVAILFMATCSTAGQQARFLPTYKGTSPATSTSTTSTILIRWVLHMEKRIYIHETYTIKT